MLWESVTRKVEKNPHIMCCEIPVRVGMVKPITTVTTKHTIERRDAVSKPKTIRKPEFYHGRRGTKRGTRRM